MPCYDDRDSRIASECPQRAAVLRVLLCNVLTPEPHAVVRRLASSWFALHTKIDMMGVAPVSNHCALNRAREELREFELKAYKFLVTNLLLERI